MTLMRTTQVSTVTEDIITLLLKAVNIMLLLKAVKIKTFTLDVPYQAIKMDYKALCSITNSFTV